MLLWNISLIRRVGVSWNMHSNSNREQSMWFLVASRIGCDKRVSWHRQQMMTMMIWRCQCHHYTKCVTQPSLINWTIWIIWIFWACAKEQPMSMTLPKTTISLTIANWTKVSIRHRRAQRKVAAPNVMTIPMWLFWEIKRIQSEHRPRAVCHRSRAFVCMQHRQPHIPFIIRINHCTVSNPSAAAAVAVLEVPQLAIQADHSYRRADHSFCICIMNHSTTMRWNYHHRVVHLCTAATVTSQSTCRSSPRNAIRRRFCWRKSANGSTILSTIRL